MLKPLFKYADFKGRANRAEYWLFALFQLIVYIGILAFSFALAGSGSIATGVGTAVLLCTVMALGCFIPNLAVTFRRLHDSNKSALWLLLYLPNFLVAAMVIGKVTQALRDTVTEGAAGLDGLAASLASPQLHLLTLVSDLGQLLLFIFLVWPGTRGPNRFGDDWRGGGFDLSVFDAPQDMEPAEMAAPAQKPPHKAIFDFTSPEPAPAAAMAPAPAPTPIQPVVPQAAAPGRQAPVFGKRR